MSKTLYMETTAIAPARTAAEITDLLVTAGATQISCNYQEAKIVGLSFVMAVSGCPVPFSLPVRTEPVYKVLFDHGYKSARSKWRYDTPERRAQVLQQAERVAWRQLLRWIQAQLALIETGMVEAGEVFMPYVVARNGRTMFQEFRESGVKMLAAPEQQR